MMPEPKPNNVRLGVPGRRDGGMTLVEVVIVMGVMALLATITFSSIRTAMPNWRLNRATRTLRTDLIETKTRAGRDMREYRLRFITSTQYTIEEGNATVASTAWAANLVRGEMTVRNMSSDYPNIGITSFLWGAAPASKVIFTPNGTLDPAEGDTIITLSNGHVTKTLKIYMSGRVRIM
jgi:prepilin-type N-terminal cleavage/methylation domain-containing protein